MKGQAHGLLGGLSFGIQAPVVRATVRKPCSQAAGTVVRGDTLVEILAPKQDLSSDVQKEPFHSVRFPER